MLNSNFVHNKKYSVSIDESVFENTYGEMWSLFTPEQKESSRKALVNAIDDFLSGKNKREFIVPDPNMIKGINISVLE